MTRSKRLGGVLALALITALIPTYAEATTRDRGCRTDRLNVPGAQQLTAACLADLTTAGTVASGHTDPADYAGLDAPGTINPTGVPGLQIDGFFRDNSTTNTNRGLNHDSQFVLRLPTKWNGGLVIAGPPAVREQYANDRTISDYVLSKGFAYAATDKGNTGPQLFRDDRRGGDAVREWHKRVTQLTIAAKVATAHHYRRSVKRTYLAGQSIGAYLVRWQLENAPGLLVAKHGTNVGSPVCHDRRMTDDSNVERMEIQRTIPAPPAAIFEMLCDPQGHVAIDSSGMLMSAEGKPAGAVGDTFLVHMDREALNDFPEMGKYDVTVTFLKFEQDREIAWTIFGKIEPPVGHFYGYRLEPVEGGTLVTSYYDWSTAHEVWKARGIFPILSEGALRATLGILHRTVLQRVAAQSA